MFKFIFYVVIFFLIGYNYGHITRGTVFDNFFVMLFSLFVLIFLIEWIFSLFRSRKNANGQEEEASISAFEGELQALQAEFGKTWDLKYNNHELTIVNKYNQEELYINGKLICEKTRSSWYSWLVTSQTLKGKLEEGDQSRIVKVKLGGIMSLNCKVYVDKELIFQEKIKYNVLTGKVKEKD
ncbi:hypothetical protein MM300_21005 [Evansella sp. LMS18]|uniref:hypothetical protein n=1 Tax=Evansella sp. LMS18 TaxID=2924033 RepID=UPI0020D0BD30|nr:hypothetical protein [Evansella sp. LMS18]UTR10325.1 hypothetical protein MM300_21005 [Evansella sp. LMS18]